MSVLSPNRNNSSLKHYDINIIFDLQNTLKHLAMKNIIIISLSLLFSVSGFAQIPSFCIGPKIGYNTSKLSVDPDVVSSELKNNFQYGAFVRFGEKVFLQPEVNYVTKGGVLKSSTTGNQDITLKTLTVPLLIGVRLVNLKVASVHLIGGPIASFAFDKNLIVTRPGSFRPINSADDIKTASWAIQAGAGIDLLIFTFDIRYEIGISEIYTSQDYSLKNNLLNVSLGLKLF